MMCAEVAESWWKYSKDCVTVGGLAAVVASFVAWTKLLHDEPG